MQQVTVIHTMQSLWGDDDDYPDDEDDHDNDTDILYVHMLHTLTHTHTHTHKCEDLAVVYGCTKGLHGHMNR